MVRNITTEDNNYSALKSIHVLVFDRMVHLVSQNEIFRHMFGTLIDLIATHRLNDHDLSHDRTLPLLLVYESDTISGTNFTRQVVYSNLSALPAAMV